MGQENISRTLHIGRCQCLHIMADWPHTWVSGDLDTREAPLKWPLEGVGESMSVGEAGAEMKLLSRDLNILVKLKKILG